MKEPRRLLSETGTSALERSLLGAGRARRDPEGARERVWGAVAIGAAGGAATAAATGSAAGAGAGAKAAGVAVALTKMKLIVAGLVIATASGATYVAVRQEPERAPVVETRAIGVATAVTTAPAPVAPNAVVMEAVTVADADADAMAKARAKAKAEADGNPKGRASSRRPVTRAAEDEAAHAVAVSELREEAKMLGDARAALTRGDARAARTGLDEARARFPKSRLGQERDALEVRVVSASGDPERAASLARAFLDHYPDSPLRAGMASIADRTPETL